MSKKRINIMLSEEAIDVLSRANNKSQYIDDLIMDRVVSTEPTRPLEVVSLQQLKAVLEEVIKSPQVKTTQREFPDEITYEEVSY